LLSKHHQSLIRHLDLIANDSYIEVGFMPNLLLLTRMYALLLPLLLPQDSDG